MHSITWKSALTFFAIMLIALAVATSNVIFLVLTEGDERKHHLQDSTQLPVPVYVL